VYGTRPGECRDYFCLWRCGWGDDEDRPKLSGLVVDLSDRDATVTVRAGPTSTPADVLRALRGVASDPEWGRFHVGVIPFGLPGGAWVNAVLPGSKEWNDLLGEVASGSLPLQVESPITRWK
jgi:hypothetical protein